MLILGSRLINSSIMSLQTGGRLANVSKAIIDPSNLSIYAYEIKGAFLSENPSFLRVADIRETSAIGMIIDSNDEFVGLKDIVKLDKLYEIGFPLVGMKVTDEHRHSLGKVIDYSVDSNSFVIQQIHVSHGMFSLSNTSKLIHRSQIIEINNSGIIVKSNTSRVKQDKSPVREFVNPFKNQSPAPSPESRET